MSECKFIVMYLAPPIWLGLSLSIIGVNVFDWKFHFVTIPFWFLMCLKEAKG